MSPDTSRYVTKELTKSTLPDFERFMETRPAPGAFTCWCMFHHVSRRPGSIPRFRSRSRLVAWNRRKKRELVDEGLTHGILVYSKGEPIGWCQYGSWDELPRYNGLLPKRAEPEVGTKKLWRITCFTVDRRYRSSGVAKIALQAALDAIRRKGGGLVEAYPIARWGAPREYLGTSSMFEKEGFEIVAPFGVKNVIMRKTI